MKKLATITSLLFLLGSSIILAEETRVSTENSKVKIRVSQGQLARPRDASALEPNLSCYYSMGSLSFEFGTPEGTAQLEIINFETAQSITETFPTGNVHYTYIGTEPGTYSILVTTNYNEYSATIVME